MRINLLLPLACFVIIDVPFAKAQSSIEEIIVTADYRNAVVSEIPASITILDEELIRNKNAAHLEEILLNAPNVNIASGASRSRFYQIRGIGERGQFSEPLNPSVGLIIDGVDYTGIGNSALLYDIEQVEILMGPQGTRYGSNALAGLINLKSKSPADFLQYGIKLDTGNFNSRGIAGYISGPVNDSLLYRISAQGLKSDGFNSNSYLGAKASQRDEKMVRAKLRWQPSTETTVDLNTAFFDIDNGYDVFSLDNIRDTISDEPGVDRQESNAWNLSLRSDSPEYFRLEGILAYSDSETQYGYDEDWTYIGFHPWEYASTDNYNRNTATYNAEVRLLSNDNSRILNDSTQWVMGVYTLHQDVNLSREYTYLTSNFTSSFNIDRTAIFAETNSVLDNNFSVDFGLRFEHYQSEYLDSENITFRPDEDLWGGKLALNYHTDSDNLLYLSASRGYKSGGFNIDGSLDADLRLYNAEYLWNYEAGFKGNVLADRLYIQAAIFFMDRDDVQISSSLTRLRQDGSTEFIEYTGNAAGGSNYGLELSTSFATTERLNTYASLGLLKSRYNNFINSTGENLDGREQAHAPGWQYTLGFNFSFTQALDLDLSLQGRDAFYYSDSHNNRSKAYSLLNANLSYELTQWRLSIWGRNLNDEDYYVRGYYFGNDPRNGYTPEVYTQLGEPRSFGLTLSADF